MTLLGSTIGLLDRQRSRRRCRGARRGDADGSAPLHAPVDKSAYLGGPIPCGLRPLRGDPAGRPARPAARRARGEQSPSSLVRSVRRPMSARTCSCCCRTLSSRPPLMFSMAALSRRAIVSYLGGLLLLGACAFNWAFVAGTAGQWELAKLLDPLGATVLSELSMVWTPLERSTRLDRPAGLAPLEPRPVDRHCLGRARAHASQVSFGAPRPARPPGACLTAAGFCARRATARRAVPGRAARRSSHRRSGATFGFTTHARQMLAVARESFDANGEGLGRLCARRDGGVPGLQRNANRTHGRAALRHDGAHHRLSRGSLDEPTGDQLDHRPAADHLLRRRAGLARTGRAAERDRGRSARAGLGLRPRQVRGTEPGARRSPGAA